MVVAAPGVTATGIRIDGFLCESVPVTFVDDHWFVFRFFQVCFF
jgi:hypothetical protein